ncbi:MAG: hypothetical protein NVSMB14_18210 [Isosphaeraceae bacterium]
MPAIERILWIVVPPAVYFLVLGRRRSGRTARVVAGAIDATWLVFGFAGFVAFGPIGSTIWASASGAWTGGAIVLAGVLLAAAWIARGRRRLVIYNVSPETLDQALREAIDELPCTFVKTVRGFEDPVAHVALVVEMSRHSRTAEISAEGPNCERRLEDLQPRLRRSLARRPDEKASFAWNDFALANLILAAPVVLILLTRPEAQKDLGRWLSGMLRSVVKASPAGRSGR